MLKNSARSLLFLLSAVACAGPAAPAAHAQAVNGFPLFASNFQPSPPRGFGDRNNSWAQAMIWWNNNLYVGTSRDSICASDFAVYEAGVAVLGTTLANAFLPYPPPDPDLSCTANAAALPLAAQIWSWSPITNAWTQVFESPDTLPNPGPGAPDPPETGYFLPYEDAFRGFAAYTEADGTQALYAFGVNTTLMWDRTQLPPPRILRTTDGINWTPLPQDSGTFLNELSFNADHASFRSPVVYNGMVFVLCGPTEGYGSLIASANPSQGDNAWFLAGDPSMFFYAMAVFNGWLYLGTYDPSNGYEVYKTQAQGMPPYALTLVVPAGGGLKNMPSQSVVSMFVHYGRLYVGTATFAEMVRINADDTWDLIMGAPRADPTTNKMKYPLSNTNAGFGSTLNDHIWNQDDPNNYLYAGTYNASTGSHLDPVNCPLLQPTMGGQLFVTPDDYHWTAVTTNGFDNPANPNGLASCGPTNDYSNAGGMWDYGFRTMASTPYGMFIGTANDYFGLTVFQGNIGASPPVQAPGSLEIEASKSGGALISWLSAFNATSYRIYRAEMLPIKVRQNLESLNLKFGSYIPDVYIGPYQLVGTTSSLIFLDSTPVSGQSYMYYVVGVSANGAVSPQSSLVTFPLLLPSVTFAQLIKEENTLAMRQRFAPPDTQGTNELTVIKAAQTAADSCQIASAISLLQPQTNSRAVLVPDQVDYDVLIGKMIRRLQVYTQFPTLVSSEFCTKP